MEKNLKSALKYQEGYIQKAENKNWKEANDEQTVSERNNRELLGAMLYRSGQGNDFKLQRFHNQELTGAQEALREQRKYFDQERNSR